METLTIKDLEDKDLVRRFFATLWVRFNVGGISYGRSIQSSLVEAFLDLTKPDDLPGLPLELEDFSREADRRLGRSVCQVLFARDVCNLVMISGQDISTLCLMALEQWYEKNENRTDSEGYIANPNQARQIRSVCRLIPRIYWPTPLAETETLRMILREARSRVSYIFQSTSLP